MSKTHLRVVHIITKLELGGAQQNTLYTVKKLNRTTFEPILICGKGGILDDEARTICDTHFIEMEREVKPFSDYRAYRELKRLLLKLKPDIVHTHSSKAGILGRLAAANIGIRAIIHTYHGFAFHKFQNPLLFQGYVAAERYAAKRQHHLIFVSQNNLDWAKELGLTNGQNASLIHSGVEVDELIAPKTLDLRNELSLPANARVAGMVACLKKQKDPLTFVEAADIVLQERQDIYFLIAGDGELRPQLEDRVKKLKYPQNFLLLGWRRDIPQLLKNFDLTVLTSLWEGLPRIIPESTISRVPVIASAIDGNREIVQEGKNGTLAEPENPSDFATKILQIVNAGFRVDNEYRKKVMTEFDIDLMVAQQEQLYINLGSGLAI